MKIAQMDRVITISSKTYTLDAYGNEVVTWSTTHTLWAARLARPSKEFFEAGRTISEQLHYYHIRHVDALDTTMRLTDENDVFDITEIKYSDKRNQSIQLACRKVA